MASPTSLLQWHFIPPSSLPTLRRHGGLLCARECFLIGESNGSRQIMVINKTEEGCKGRSRIYRKRRSEVRIRNGLPVVSSIPVLGPILNTVFSPLVLIAVYVIGATKFFSGFSSTTYTDSLPTKLGLTLAWPVLFLASQKYRSNFKRAVR